MTLALQALYLFSPLLLAAALSAIVLRYDLARWLRRPIDGGLSLGGRRVLGDSKTWRGVVVAIAGCVAGVAAQRYLLAGRCASFSVVDYRALDVVGFGTAMGAGAMLGELPNSFTKRRLGIAPGKTTRGAAAIVFYVWDQVDLLTGAWPLVAWWIRPSVPLVIASVAVTLAVHPLVAVIGYLVRARTSPR